MSTQVIINNSEKYRLEFSDAFFAFNEDLEYTVDHYCSMREIEYDDIGKLLFVLHSHISKLKYNDGISEALRITVKGHNMKMKSTIMSNIFLSSESNSINLAHISYILNPSDTFSSPNFNWNGDFD